MARGGDLKGPRPSSRVLRVEDLPQEVLDQFGLEVEKPTKYRNRRVVVDGIKVDSQKEADRWGQLRLLEAAGEIRNLRRQVRYKLIVNNILITTYVCDFTYEREGQFVVEDAKGMVLPIFKIKQKLMRACLGIDVKII